MNKLFCHFLAAVSTTLLLANPVVAEQTGSPSDSTKAGKSTDNSSSYQNIEAEIKRDQANLQAEANKERAKLQTKLMNEVHQNDGFDPEAKQVLTKYIKERGGSWENVSPLPLEEQKKVQRAGALPPGWQKNLGLGDVIPENVYQYHRSLPKDIYNRFSHPAGTEDILIDDQLYRIAKKTHQIIDIFSSSSDSALSK